MLAPIRFALRRTTTTEMLHTACITADEHAPRRASHVRGMDQVVLAVLLVHALTWTRPRTDAPVLVSCALPGQ